MGPLATIKKVMLRRQNITENKKTRDNKRYGSYDFVATFECSSLLWQSALSFQLIPPKDSAPATI
jgi:hypothetical protein